MNGWVERVAKSVQHVSINLMGALLATMFAAFIIQIVFRYFTDYSTGWTTELSLVSWLWMVLLGTALALGEKDEIRFDIFHSAAGPTVRRVMGGIVAAAAVVLYAWSLPATVDYVAFMKVERSAYLDIRRDWLYSVYVIFAVAVIVRYGWLLWRAIKGGDAEPSAVASEARAP
jgi:TRAP-type C4-dicarboxylate transport system permease small subunit